MIRFLSFYALTLGAIRQAGKRFFSPYR